jgi:XTP/dITP diphosphohydrolase
MQLVLATSNQGKVREIQEMCEHYDVVPYTDLIAPFEIIEDADTFKENALIKARAVFEALNDDTAIVIADDSGISIDALEGAPGVFSARYAKEGASDKENLDKAVAMLKEQGVALSPAHYTAAMAIVGKSGAFTVHGWMYGNATSLPRGDKGFGYDPMFIPLGYKQTLGELDDEVKKTLSHRSQALRLARVILQALHH